MRRSFALPCLLGLSLVGAPGAAPGEQVSFDEYTPMNDPGHELGEEYAHLGLHFFQAGSIWGGMSAGDPGGWGLEGTLGPAFMGFPGPSFNLVMLFDAPVASLGFDMARARPGPPGSMRFSGYRDGQLVEEQVVPFPDTVGEWTLVEMSQAVDILVGVARDSGPYGVDRLTWSGAQGDEPLEMPVEIDILPGSDDNPIRLGRRGVLPVVLYGSESFDVESVDPATLGFGPGAAPLAHKAPHATDHDGDGWLDWILHHRVEQAGLAAEDAEACLVGETWEGDLVVGCDLVTPVGRR